MAEVVGRLLPGAIFILYGIQSSLCGNETNASATVGYTHSVILKTDGSLWTTGLNTNGRLGDGTTTNQSSPIQILSTGVKKVGLSDKTTFFIKSDNTLWGAGNNGSGALGDGTTTDRYSPVSIWNGNVSKVEGFYHTLFLESNGTLRGMGYNGNGPLGNGTTTDQTSPIIVMDSNVSEFAAGSEHTLIVKSDGTLWGIGKNGSGQLGDGTTTRRTTPVQIFSWEEKASHSLARYAYDGLEVIDGKLYFAGGHDGTDRDTFESYDPATNQWTTLPSLSTARHGTAGAILNGKLYIIGGELIGDLDSVEIYDTTANSWSAGTSLPFAYRHGKAISLNGKILIFGGYVGNTSSSISDVREYDPSTDTWSSKASMNTARYGHKIALHDNKVWVMGGRSPTTDYLDSVEIYDPAADSWSAGPSLISPRLWPVVWTTNGSLYVAGGKSDSSTYPDTIETYDPSSNSWKVVGSLPSSSYAGDATVIGDKVYLVPGHDGSSHSNKLFVADLSPVSKVAGGMNHSLILKEDSSLWAMGENQYGQLGDGTTTTRSTPVRIVDANITAVSAGANASYFLKNDGSLWAMGDNRNGQLGKGAETQPSLSGLIAYYPFDGNTSDMSGNNQTSTLTGSPQWVTEDGRTSMYIDQDAQKLSLSYADFHSNFTYTFWAKPTATHQIDSESTSGSSGTSGQRFLMYPRQADSNSGVGVSLGTNGVSIYEHGNFSLPAVCVVSEDLSDWNFYSIVVSNNQSNLYLNGSFKRAALNSGRQLYRSTEIAQNYGSDGYLGYLDEFRIYDQALSASEISTLYDLSNTSFSSPIQVLDANVSSISSRGDHAYFLKNDKSLWVMGNNNYGQLGDGTTTSQSTPVQIMNGLQVQPKAVTVNSTAGGTTTGAGTYDLNTTTNLVATPNLGYLFTGWTGDLTSTDSNVSITLSANKEVNATFTQDTADTDADGLSNYAELVTHSTDPNDSDSDDDTLNDSEEVSIGLDPNTANSALVTFFDNREANARSDGNTSGITYAQANYSSFNLYTEAEKNASDDGNYTLGVSDGNASGITYAQANYSNYNLYTEAEKNASDDGNYTLGVSDGNTSGIGYAQANYSSYNLYTEAEKNASDDGNYTLGVSDGNASGIGYAQANYSSYNLYTEAEKNASDDGNYTLGVSDGNASGIGYAQANYSSYNLYTEAEKNASGDGNYSLGVRDGNTSGIGYAQVNYLSYDLYTEAEKNISDDGNYTLGVRDGNTSGIGYAQVNYLSYDLYTEAEKNISDDGNYSHGMHDGNVTGIAYGQSNLGDFNLYTFEQKTAAENLARAAGKVESLAMVEADMASKGLGLITYVEQLKISESYTQNWYYQPEMGWLWTDEKTFPYIYQQGQGGEAGRWLYFSQLADQQGPAFYDYQQEHWVYPN